MSGSMPGFGGSDEARYGEGRERGARRRKLAGYLKAANELRQSYQQSYTQNWGSGNADLDDDPNGIPGAFPDVAIVSHGDEQLLLFPSYAKRHIKETPNPDARRAQGSSSDDGPGDAEYWDREWRKFEDDRAIVDVDVRGWVYSPHRGPLNRKNRLLIGLARQLSGIPAPAKSPNTENGLDASSSLRSRQREHEARLEQERIALEAEQILKKGEGEGNVAAQGGYSENPRDRSDAESIYGDRGRSGTPSDDPPGPGNLQKRPSWNQPSDMSQAELAAANAHLMSRLKPFLTNPLVSIPITVFFYDEKTSVSRTITSNEAGHFNMRAALDFIPTHVRVLASEGLSATEEIKIMQPKGVSVISDVDDTIKHSSIGSGAREIFRNAFIRELGDLTIDGVREWYNKMYDMGVGLHYVSNSPWQLFPVLMSFFRVAGLPPGSYHLKQYSGMLQGIFEPVAERKKGTLERIMRDFPQRKFILIGDSGEADLEVYTDVVLANPGKILAVFIRDVTTPQTPGFFDSTWGPLSGERRRRDTKAQFGDSTASQVSNTSQTTEQRPKLPPRVKSEATPKTSDGPTMGKLIDFDDEPEQASTPESRGRVMPRSSSDFQSLDIPRRKSAPDSDRAPPPRPPPRPSKPLALRSMTVAGTPDAPEATEKRSPPPPPKPRRSQKDGAASHPLSQATSSSDLKDPNEGYVSIARHKVSEAYNALPPVSSYLPGESIRSSQSSEALASSSPERPPALPPRRGSAAPVASSSSKQLSRSSTEDLGDGAYRPTNAPMSKKLDLWKRRWIRAKDILDSRGVALRSWRVGSDACPEAIQMIEKALAEMGVEGYGVDGQRKGKTGQGGGEMKTKDLKR